MSQRRCSGALTVRVNSSNKAIVPAVTLLLLFVVKLTAMVMLSSLLLTTRRSIRYSTCSLGVTAFPVAPRRRLPAHGRFFPAIPSPTTSGKNIRHLGSWLSATFEEGQYQPNRPQKYLTAEDLAVNDDQYPQRSYISLSDFEEDVESMAANYLPEPDDFLDDLEFDDGYNLPSPPRQELPQSVKQSSQGQGPVQGPLKPKGTSTPGDNLDPSTSTTQNNAAGVWGSQGSPSSTRKTTSTTATTATSTATFFTAKTASRSPSKTAKLPLTDPFMAGIANPVRDNDDGDGDDYGPQQFISLAEPLPKDLTFDSLVMSDSRTIVSTREGDDDELALSREEFRSKFVFEEDQASLSLNILTPPAAESSRTQDELFLLQQTLKSLEKQITTANNGSPINLSSYKQVSQALFGTPDESTSKNVLEGMAVSNILAKLILEHRQTLQRYNRLKKKEESYQNNQKIAAATMKTTTTTSKAPSLSTTEPLLLVDTSSFIFRAYYSMPPMHRADGMPVSAVLGFCNLLNKMVLKPLLAGKQPRLVLCCDAPTPASGGPKTWRHDLYLPYKANRQQVPMDLVPQFPYFRLAAQAYGMTWIEAPGYEADDVIASLAQKALQEGLTTHIYSSDKDLMQLITNSTMTDQGGRIEMVEPSTMTHWNHDSVVEKWGVPAHQLGDVLALAGDTADNIPGVPGIGPKIAAQLLEQFGSLEGLLSNLALVPQAKRREKLELYRNQAILSQQLVQLERNLDWAQMSIDFPDPAQTSTPLPDRVADLKMQVMNPDRILRFYDQMGFISIKERFIEQLQKRSMWQGAYAEAISPTAKRKTSKWQSKDKVEVPNPDDFDNIPF